MMKRNRLFLKYFIVNLGLVMMILIGVLADAAYTYRLQKSSVISQNENRMELGVGELETTIKSMYTMSSTLRSNESLGILSRYQGETLTADKFVFLNYLKNELLNLKLIADLPATGFILFRDNDVYVSNAQTAEKFEDYYGTFFEVSGKSKEEFKEEIMDCTAPVTCKTYDSITIYDSGMKKLEHPLLVVVRIIDANHRVESSAFVFVVPRNELYRQLYLDSTNNLACICDSAGNILCTYGAGAEELAEYRDSDGSGKTLSCQINGTSWYLLRSSVEDYGIRMLMAVPTRQVMHQTLQLLQILIILLVITVIVSIVEIVGFSYRKSSVMQGVLDDIVTRSGENYVHGDELSFIREHVEQIADSRDSYQKDLSELRMRMRDNMLEQMFLQEMMSGKMREQCQKLIPPGMKYFFVLVIQCEEEDPDILTRVIYTLDRLFDQHTDGNYLTVQTAVNEKSFLLEVRPDESIDMEKERRKLEQLLQKSTEMAGEAFHMGISGIGMDCGDVHTCYVQAKQALVCCRREHTNTVGYYPELLNMTGDNLTNMDFMNKIYQYLLCGERQAFEQSLDKLLRHYKMNPYLYERNRTAICSSLWHAVSCAAMELSVPEKELESSGKCQNGSFEESVEDLRKAAVRLLEIRESQKKSHNTELREKITAYIAEHFQKPNFSSEEVCRETKISEKYLTQFLKEQTGKTFVKYVEDLRIEKAKEMLLMTNESNEKIAESVGFGAVNSFYRVFNRKMGISPGQFRKNKSTGEN